MSIDIKKALDSHNIADDLDEETLKTVGEFVKKGYDSDVQSRKGWEQSIDKWTELALQVMENKSFPWPKAANVKYPLLSTAAMQFAARAYPALVPSDGKLVQTRVVGADRDGAKQAKAEHISKHMSWQLTYQMPDWEEEMDKLLVILPVVGTCFKKTFYDANKGRNCSKLVLPKDLVVNYWAKSLEDAERKTERIEMSKRMFKERQMEGIYRDVTLPSPTAQDGKEHFSRDKTQGATAAPVTDDSTPYIILEQHTFYDLDGDDYPEPYIITIEEQSKEVLRIVARYEESGIKRNQEGKLSRIEAIEYYTKFPFIPNPDGGFYDVGFGLLLGSINDTVNTSINQLIDSGTLNNLPSGFISKNLRMRDGNYRLEPGEFKWVNASGEQLKNGVLPMPIKEPSNVLLELMKVLVEAGTKLSSVAEIFVGKMPGQNTPATTTMASIEQGMKLFTAIYKRIYKALEKEYQKLFRLNGIYLSDEEIAAVLDEPVSVSDYDKASYDVCPGADPTAFSSTQKLMKAQALLELAQLGTLNMQEVTLRILEAQEQPNMEKLINQQPAPDPKMLEMQMKGQLEQQKVQLKAQEGQFKMELAKREAELKAQMEQQKHQMEMQFAAQKAQLDLQVEQLKARGAVQAQNVKMQGDVQKHQLDMAASAQKHQLSIKQAKEKAAAKPKPAAKPSKP